MSRTFEAQDVCTDAAAAVRLPHPVDVPPVTVTPTALRPSGRAPSPFFLPPPPSGGPRGGDAMRTLPRATTVATATSRPRG